MERSDWEQAEQLLSKAVQTCPGDSEARRYYAESLWHRGRRPEAIVQLEGLVRVSPEDASLRARLAQMRLETGDISLARREAELALDLDPKLSLAWAIRGRVMLASGAPQQALADFHRALAYSPEDRGLLLEIAQIHRQMNQPQRALTTLQTLTDTYSPGEEPQQLLYLLGVTYAALGRHDEAAESLALAAGRGPADPEILARLGQSQLDLGRTREAMSAVREALALDPRHGPSLALMERLQTASDASGTLRR